MSNELHKPWRVAGLATALTLLVWFGTAHAADAETLPAAVTPESSPAVVEASPALATTAPVPWHEVRIGWSPRAVLRRDLLFSPRWYAGPALAATTLEYAWTGRRWAHRAPLDISMASVRSQPGFEVLSWPDGEVLTSYASSFTSARMDYALLRVVTLTPRLSLMLGGAFDMRFEDAQYALNPFWTSGYYGTLGLDVRAELRYRLSARHSLTAEAALPLFAWVARSPYAINDGAQIYASRDNDPFKTIFRYLGAGHFETWNRLQRIDLKLRYVWQPITSLGLGVTAEAGILSETHPRPVLSMAYGLGLSLNIRF